MSQLLLLGKVEYGGGPIFMAYNVISCQKVAENTQILKIAKFAM